MAAPPHTLKIVEQSQVSPPPGSVPTTSLPLTFFDILFHVCCPMQRLCFYQSPYSTQFIYQTFIPNLKKSLSLTLKHFFPFSGNLICTPSPARPHILYTEGDSVPLTIAESDANFDRLTADYPRDVHEHHRFVPKLPPTRTEGDTRVVPLMALQITVFPNSGISIGVTFCHMAADGRAFYHFMKSWASVCKSNGDLRFIETSTPFHDRDSIKIPSDVEGDVLKSFWDWAAAEKEDLDPLYLIKTAGKVRATFGLGQTQIERLKHWVEKQCTKEELDTVNISRFVVTCALIWVCFTKSSQSMEMTKFSKEDEPYFFAFVGDCRNRLEPPVPNTYFGNCLAFCFVSVNRNELLADKGIVAAAKGIGKRVKQLECNGVLEGAENWMQELKEIAAKYQFLSVAGSPRFHYYDTDFGLGGLKKTEVLHTDVSGAICLSDSRESEFGIEVSLTISKAQMDCFTSVMKECLKSLMI